MKQNKPNILFLPAWYPHRNDAMFGLFVKNHAITILPHCNVAVIYVKASNTNSNKYEIEVNEQNELLEIIIYFRKNDLSIIGPFINAIKMLISYKKAWKTLLTKRAKPDISHVHILTRAGVIAYIIKLIYNIPYVITEHWSRYYSFNDTYNGSLRKFITKKVVKKASAMSTVSNSLKEAMISNGIKNSNWSIIPNSINTDIFKPSSQERSSNKTRIFHISCFEDKSKNVSGIIRGFAEALKKNKELELVMIGIGEDHEKVVNLALELQLNESIEFTGELNANELVKKINSCDFSLLFSNYETFAIVIIESLAAGKPVIATNAGAIPEVLPKEYGIIIEPRDITGLSHAILDMAKNHNNYNKEEMRNYAISNFDIKKVGIQLNNFYKSVIN